MPTDPPSEDQRQRRRGLLRPLLLRPLASAAGRQPAETADPAPLALPAWRIGTARRHDMAADSPPPPPLVAPGPRPFAADRAAARYAPDGAGFEIGDRSLPVLTVSMSGIALRWDGARLPASGTRIEGEVTTGDSHPGFGAAFDVVRLEPEQRLVAGRFARLSGPAMDRLLSWLSRLDRAAAGR